MNTHTISFFFFQWELITNRRGEIHTLTPTPQKGGEGRSDLMGKGGGVGTRAPVNWPYVRGGVGAKFGPYVGGESRAAGRHMYLHMAAGHVFTTQTRNLHEAAQRL